MAVPVETVLGALLMTLVLLAESLPGAEATLVVADGRGFSPMITT